jgi:hypothetical protein
MGAVVGVVVLLAAVVAVGWAVVREVRADGYGRRRPDPERDWGDQRTPSCPYASARW